ncbi:MAG: TRAM domain-containing protein [Anaerolineae bacterium]|nr:TRAM domain-containing protein [Anaerolineae bacterium]
MRDDQIIEVELTAMAHGGSALGRHGQQIIFVPYTIPGERVEARIVNSRGRVAFADGVRLLDASVDRVFPVCKHFGPHKCGRCHWQHIDYSAQLLIKQDVLADQLARIGGFEDVDVQPVIPSPQQWGYNYHMTMVAGEDGIPGFVSVDDDRIIMIDECTIMHPDLLALYESLDLQFDGLRQLRLQLGSDGNPMLILTMANDDAPELETDIPTSVNMLLTDHEPVNLIGESHSRYVVQGRTLRVTAGSEFRSNVAQLGNLVTVVTDALDLNGDEAVLDLYGGVGLFSAFLEERAGLVTLVESFPPAATDADENLAEYDHIDIVEGTVEDVLSDIDGFYDAAVIDPPSSGISVEAVDQIADLGIPHLVYVSSDPATLARDAKRLAGHGYQLVSVQPIDLAPQTYYIDSVAVLRHIP